jgi:flagellar biosynthesis/type III secretory pathway protein FliH
MPGIIKSSTQRVEQPAVGAVVFNFDDMTGKANAYLGQVKVEAARLLAEAEREAVLIRKQAQEQGTRAANEAAEKTVQARVEAQVRQQMQTVLPAVRQMVAAMTAARTGWLAQWEQNALRLSIAIAEKIVRRELATQPPITLGLVREALEMAAGCQSVQVVLHPDDRRALGPEVEQLAAELAGIAPSEILADPSVSPGGCVVKTEYGAIDERIETQLSRIAEELT